MGVVERTARGRRGPGCPSDDELARFASGGTAVGPDLSEHIAGCPLCAAQVASALRTAPTRSDVPMLPAGSMIGRYRIEATLGAGGMGVVYRARDLELDRQVALKLVHPRSGMPVEILTERLRRESRLQARAAHRAVITVYDIGRDGNEVYVAMELVNGGSLRHWVATARDWRAIVDVLREAGAGLAAAHAAGLVHRDFKPDNVLVQTVAADAEPRVHVIDFGVARALDESELEARQSRERLDVDLTATGALVGTPAYMAPEQLHAGPVDARTDVFAFAATAWEALYGVRAYPGTNVPEIAAAMASPIAPPPRTRIPRWVEATLRRGLAFEPAQRFPDMASMLVALDWRRHRSRRVAIAAGASAAIVAAGVAGLLATRSPPAGAMSPCSDDVPERLARINPAVLGSELAPIAEDFRARWTAARSAACSDPQPNADDRALCVSRRGASAAALLALAAAADAERRHAIALAHARILGGLDDCLSPAAGALAQVEPADDDGIAAVAKIRVGLAEASAPGTATYDFAPIAAEAASAKFPPVLHEVALLAAARGIGFGGRPLDELRRVATAAERADHVVIAAEAAMYLLTESLIGGENLGRIADLVANADVAITRAGDPGRLRIRWHVARATLTMRSGDGPGVHTALQAIEHYTVLHPRSPEPDLDSELGLVYMYDGQLEKGMELERRALANAAGRLSLRANLSIRTSYAVTLSSLGKNDEALAVVAPVLDVTDRSVFDPIERASALALAAEIYNTSPHKQRDALDLLDRWSGARAKLAPARPAIVGRLAFERCSALAALERGEEAVRECRYALEIFVERFGSKNAQTADAHISLADALLVAHRPAEARDEAQRGVDDSAVVLDAADLRLLEARLILARALVETGDLAKAQPLAEAAIARFGASEDTPDQLADGRFVLARCLAKRDPKQARRLATQALTFWTSDRDGHETRIAAATKFLGRR